MPSEGNLPSKRYFPLKLAFRCPRHGLFFHEGVPKKEPVCLKKIMTFGRESEFPSSHLPQKMFGAGIGEVGIILYGQALNHYTLNQDISKWDFAAHGAFPVELP